MPRTWDAARFRSIVDNLREVVFHTDAHGVWTYLNPAWTEITGFSVEESLGKPALAFVSPEDHEAVRARFRPMIEGTKDSCHEEIRYRTRDGELRWLDVHARVARDSAGAIAGTSGTLSDVTARRQASEQLRATQQQLEALLASSPAVLFRSRFGDGLPSLLYMSENSRTLLGYESGELVNNPLKWAGCIHPDDLPALAASRVELATNGFTSYCHRFLHPDGNYRWLRLDARLVKSADGSSDEVAGCLVDVSASQETEQALRRREAVLDAVSFAAQRFLNSASWKDEVAVVLERLARAAEVARITVRQISNDAAAELRYHWNPQGSDRRIPVVDVSNWTDALSRGESIFGAADSFPEPNRAIFQRSGIRSAAVLPVFVEQTLWGILTFADTRLREWNPLEIEAFKAAAGIVGAAIGRDRADEAVRWREALLSSMTSAAPLGFYVVDKRTDKVLYSNHRFREIWGIERLEQRIQRGEMLSRDIIQACAPVLKDAAAFVESCKPLRDEDKRTVLEDEIPFADGRVIRRFSTQIRDAADRYFGRLFIFEDVTGRRRVEAALVAARTELEERVRDRTSDLERLNETLRNEIAERRTIELTLARSEQHYRALIENTVDVIVLLDGDKRIRYASPSLHRILGYEPDEVEGREFSEFVRPEEREQVLALIRFAAARPGTHAPAGFSVSNRAGEFRVVRAIVNNQLANPGIRRLIVTLSDITEQQRAERELRENELRYRLLFQASSDGIVLAGQDRRVVDCNLAACRIFGYSREEMHGLPLDALDGGESGQAGPWTANNLERGVAPEGFGRSRDGRVFPVEVHGRTVAIQGECFLIAFVRDMTEREASERTLRESEQRYRAFVEQSTEGIWRVDFSEPIPVDMEEDEQVERMYALGFVAECNDVNARLYGFSSAAEMAGTRLKDMLVPSDPANRGHLLRLIRSGYRLVEDESYESDRDGRIHCFLNNVVGLVENGKLQRLWGTHRDITERKAAEARIRAAQRALRDSEELYRSLIETSPDAILLLDPDHTMRVLNPQAVALFGFRGNEDALGHGIGELIAEAERPRVTEIMRSKLNVRSGIANLELMMVNRAGASFPAEVSASMVTDAHGNCTGILTIVRDITERKQADADRKQLEEQFRQSQKMEAVGRLAGGVAHDFNNLLTVIVGYCELLLKRADPANPMRRNLGQIKKAADRAAALVQQLLAFSRKQMIEPKVLDVSATVADLEKMLRRLIGEDVELVTRLSPDAGFIKADPGQVEQLIMNLTVNARDAMPHGGVIVIESRPASVPAAAHGRDREVPPGSYVLLSVRDTGLGMSEGVRSRIFEPFFTTKEVGKGTGLGLSTVYGIVKQGGGHINVHSEPGKGTEFRIYLPAVQPERPWEDERNEPVPPASAAEVVLLAEDEELVREMARETLEAQGYRVLDARNGEQALMMAERHAGAIHLLLSDVVMPRMGGPELAEALRRNRPELKVMYMSGYADRDLGTVSPLLRKPFTPDDLVRRVQQVMQEGELK